MAFFSRSRGGFRPRRRMAMGRRSFRRARDPQRTKGLEVANFFVDEVTQVDNSSAAEAHIYTNMASIAISLTGQSTLASNSEQRVGAVLSQTWRSIMLNGIVMDWGMEQIGDQDGTGNAPEQGNVWTCFQMLTDRIDPDNSAIPTPASVSQYSPFSNDWPVAVLSSTSPTALQENVRQPTRIHFQKTSLEWTTSAQILAPNEGALYIPQSQQVRFRNPTINKRLRIRIDDNHGFFLAWHFRNNATFANEEADALRFRRWARGQLYYRVLA